MKLQINLTVIGSLAGFVTSPMLQAAPDVVPAPDSAIHTFVRCGTGEPCLTPVGKGDDSDIQPDAEGSDKAGETDDKPDHVVIDKEVVENEGEAVTPVENEEAGGEPIPLDWVKRGGDQSDVIFQNMAGGEAPVFKGSTARELGQDDKAAVIEAKGAAAAPIKGEKKAPVALIKKGRVFLR